MELSVTRSLLRAWAEPTRAAEQDLVGGQSDIHWLDRSALSSKNCLWG